MNVKAESISILLHEDSSNPCRLQLNYALSPCNESLDPVTECVHLEGHSSPMTEKNQLLQKTQCGFLPLPLLNNHTHTHKLQPLLGLHSYHHQSQK